MLGGGVSINLHAQCLGIHNVSLCIVSSHHAPIHAFLPCRSPYHRNVITGLFWNQILFLHISFPITQVISHFSGSSASCKVNIQKFSFLCSLITSSESLPPHRQYAETVTFGHFSVQVYLEERRSLNSTHFYLVIFLGTTTKDPEVQEFSRRHQTTF